MFESAESTSRPRAIGKLRTFERGAARSCGGKNFGAACRTWWPQNTAAHLAAEIQKRGFKCGLRSAELYIAGHREPSPGAMLVAIDHLFK